VVLAAGPDDELGDAGRAPGAGLVHRGVALVVVVVARQDDVGVGVDEVVPDRRHLGRVAVLAVGEAGLVPVGEDAGVRVGREVGPEPRLLRVARAQPPTWEHSELSAIRCHAPRS
jgi:hypothetical protein